jgi:hypothetical protein
MFQMDHSNPRCVEGAIMATRKTDVVDVQLAPAAGIGAADD